MAVIHSTDYNELENVKYSKYLSSMTTNDARFTRGIKSRIAMTKAAFNKKRKRTLFTKKLDLHLRKKLVSATFEVQHCNSAEPWTLRKVDQKYLESFEMWCTRRKEKTSWNFRVRNDV